MNTTPVRLKPLADMVEKGYDIIVLDSIQRSILMQVIEERRAIGLYEHPGRDVRLQAEALLPKGFALETLYMERRAAMVNADMEDLRATADNLSLCADNLEQIAARAMATQKPTAQQAEIEHLIAKRYAQLIIGAKTLEDQGVIAVHRRDELKKLTEPAEGPLRAFFTKAQILIEDMKQRAAPARMRMAA